jgi:hypothetical protein
MKLETIKRGDNISFKIVFIVYVILFLPFTKPIYNVLQNVILLENSYNNYGGVLK